MKKIINSTLIGVLLFIPSILSFDWFSFRYGLNYAYYLEDPMLDSYVFPFQLGKYLSMAFIILSIIILFTNLVVFLRIKRVIAHPFERNFNKLQEIEELKTKHYISEEEYNAKREQIINNL